MFAKIRGMKLALGIGIALALGGGCKKQPKPDETPAPGSNGPPQVGHAKLHGNHGDDPDTAPALGSAVASAPIDAGEEAPAGKPAYRDESGHVHGPGGPVNMGEGAACDAARDHCQRKPAWFAASDISGPHQFRATPTYKFEDAWYDWRGEPIDKGGKLYKTKVIGSDSVSRGTKVIFFEFENDDTKWANSEFDALTSSRWDAGLVESSSGSNIHIAGVGDVPKDTVRLITETLSY